MKTPSLCLVLWGSVIVMYDAATMMLQIVQMLLTHTHYPHYPHYPYTQ